MASLRTALRVPGSKLCWWFFVAHSALAADGARGRPANRQNAPVYHPGHQATHVTRLLRYDHQGIGSLIQAEQEWASDRGFGPQLSETTSASGFLSLSEAQTRALQDHHERMAAAAGASLRSTAANAEMLVHDHKYCARGVNNGSTSARAVIGLTNLFDSQYVGPIGVGSILQGNCQKQNVRSLEFIADTDMDASNSERQNCHVEDQSKIWVVFDTGSTNIWVASDLCKVGPCAKRDRRRYDHTKSLSYSPGSLRLAIQFGTGQIKGPQAIDDFHVGPFSVYNQTFGMIEDETGEVFNSLPFEGILGLSFKSMAAGGHTPFFDNVISQSALKNNEFAFYFSTKHKAGNAVLWGGVDKHFYKGDIEYFPVVDPYYWSLDLLQFRIGKEVLLGADAVGQDDADHESGEADAGEGYALLALNGTSKRAHGLAALQSRWWGFQRARPAEEKTPKAIVDTGTTYFTAEGSLYGQITARIGAASCSSIDSSSHPPLVYRLRNVRGEAREFRVPHQQYMAQSGQGEDKWCTPSFMQIDIPKEHGPAMVLGEVFLRHNFAVFDRGSGESADAKIGFAPAVHSKEALRHLKKLTQGQQSFEVSSDSSSI